jgi:hypothetical protein
VFILFVGNISLDMSACTNWIVGIATGLQGGRSGVRIPTGQISKNPKIFSKKIQKLSEAHSASGYRGSLAGIKRLGCDVDQLPSFGVQVMNDRNKL